MTKVDKWLNRLTLEQKLGQMICIRASDYERQIHAKLSGGTVGAVGAVLFSEYKNDPEAFIHVLNEYHALSPIPPLFYLDAEQGVNNSLSYGTSFPSMMALGATFSKELAFGMGETIAKEARAMGFGIVGSPVLDINSNPRNPIINTRAISDKVEHIIELADAYVKGMQEALVIPTGKHFPGHGDTREDSHVSMPTVSHSREYLEKLELKPFRELVERGMMGIMTAHILYPALSSPKEGKVPATLSKAIITGLLRNQFGFQGLIVSDSLTMKSVKDRYGIGKTAVMAVQSGHDIILQDYQSNPEITYRALAEAVKQGNIPMAQVDASVKRILSMKERFGWHQHKHIDANAVRSILENPEHVALSQTIANQSITVLEAKHLPLKRGQRGKVLLIATKSEDEGQQIEDMEGQVIGKTGYLRQQLMKFGTETDLCVVNEQPTDSEISDVETQLRKNNYDHVIYAAFVRVLSYKKGSGTIPQEQFELIRKVKQLEPSLILIIFGSPYILQELDRFDNCLCAYDDCDYSLDAAVNVLLGVTQPSGKLPVTVDDRYKYGYGITGLEMSY